MILKSKICGVSDSKTLNFVVNHKNPPLFIGFIVNYTKSKRYVDIEDLKDLIKIDKKKSFYVAVLVDPEKDILNIEANQRLYNKVKKAINTAGKIQFKNEIFSIVRQR